MNVLDEEERSYSDRTAVASWGLFIPRREHVTKKTAKLALFPGSLHKSLYCTHGPLQGNNVLVPSRQCFRKVEVVTPLVDPWQTYVPFPPLLSTLLTPIFVAGSGKSVLWFVVSCHCCPHSLRLLSSSQIIEDVKAQRQAGLAIVAYFYCDFRDEDKQNCRSLVLTIISQLCTQSNLCRGILSSIYLAHDEGIQGLQKPSTETLINCLTEMVSLPVQVPIYLIVDALDECPNIFGFPTPRKEVLNLIDHLVGLRLPNLHICVTSRPEIDIQNTLEPLTSLHLSLHNQSGQKNDIVDYVRSVVYSDKKMGRWHKEDVQLVIETLSERADGM